MGAFGSSTSLASAGSTGSLAGLSGSQGRNAGVYAASDLGPFEPAFGPEPAYRDPSADALECAPGREPRFRRVRRIETEREGRRARRRRRSDRQTPRGTERLRRRRGPRGTRRRLGGYASGRVRQRGRGARGRRFVPAPSRASGGSGARPVAARRGDRAEGAAGHRPRPRPRAASDGGGARGAARRGRERARSPPREAPPGTPTRARRRAARSARGLRRRPPPPTSRTRTPFPRSSGTFGATFPTALEAPPGSRRPSGTEARAPAGTRSSRWRRRGCWGRLSLRAGAPRASRVSAAAAGTRATWICVGPARRGVSWRRLFRGEAPPPR